MNRLSATGRAALGLAFAGVLTMLVSAPSTTAGPRYRTPGPGEIVLPAGQGIHGEYEPQAVPEYAPIADLDAAGNQHLYEQQARALPASLGGLEWKNVGPLGQDDPTDYPTGAIRFARSAGMGSTLLVDPADETGNSLYAGNMGGLWYSKNAGKNWTALSDGEFTRAAVGAIGVDPDDPDKVYVGTGIGYLTTSGDAPGSGIWVSHNHGKSFFRPAKNMKGYASNDIAVTKDGVVVGTSNGLYVSTNDGASFERVVLPSNADHTGEAKGAYANWISAVAVNPINADEITVAVGLSQGKRPGPDGKPLSPGNGLYRSTTGPEGPYEYLEGSDGLRHEASSADPLGRIMLSYGVGEGGDSVTLWAILSDAGLAYGKQPAEADLVTETTGEGLNATNTMLNGVYRSDDNGGTWEVKATPQSLSATINEGLGIYPALGYGVGVQATYNLWIEADPRDPDQIYFGLEEVFQSVEGTGPGPQLGVYEIIQRYWDVCGSTTYLENIFKGQSCPDQVPYYGGVSTHPDQHWAQLTFVGDDKVRMYTANDGGFYWQDSHPVESGRDAFDNDNWVEMNTISTVQPYKIARKPDGEYLTALQDNGGGFFKPGETAILVSSGDGVNALETTDPDTWYYSAQGAIMYVTTDHGKTIRAIPADLAGATFLSPMAIDPTDDKHLVVAGRDIHETTLGADTKSVIDPVAYTVVQTDWKQSFDAGTSPVSKAAYQSQAAAIRGEAVYVAICGLCRNTLGDPMLVHATVATNVGEEGCEPKKASTDCWHVAAGKGLPRNSIWNLAIDPRDTKTIYVVLNNNSMIGYDPKVGGTQRVMVSHDAGETFTDITGNLPRSQARDVVVRDDKLVVATDNGVFTAPLTGKTWSRLGSGLPAVRVNDLHLDPTGRYLTAGVYGRGVWVLDYQSKARNSAGPGPKGEPHKPRQPAGPGTGIPATGANAALSVLAVALGGLAVATRRARRRAA